MEAQQNTHNLALNKAACTHRMGTHPSGPSVVAATGQTLKEWVQAHPDALGKAVLKRFGNDLPFLFKVTHRKALRCPHEPRHVTHCSVGDKSRQEPRQILSGLGSK